MADEKKEVKKEKPEAPARVTVKIPKVHGQDNSPVFVSVNNATYYVRRGEEVEVPPEVAEVIRNSEWAKDEMFLYEEEAQERGRKNI